MFRIGLGIDVHSFANDRKLILGGVEIPHTRGLLGHSDADVLTHSIMDALLGAVAAGDIGKHFPDTDNTYKNISSLILLEKVRKIIKNLQFKIVNIDSVIIVQKPKLLPYIETMQKKIADVLLIEKDSISIKATTSEYLGFTGREEGIICYTNALLQKL
ncbi:MAG TPA: 2-C-methyl-D-erythritol 2,4-cyclodiphosphate synthase [bacterium]|mgnify:CR=1 FL=1|nr:2-C-methyl-D-erythritol 2,4-cyclodiphosphate synthase [bacterium]